MQCVIILWEGSWVLKHQTYALTPKVLTRFKKKKLEPKTGSEQKLRKTEIKRKILMFIELLAIKQ